MPGLEDLVYAEAVRQEVNPELAVAVARAESGLNQGARSPAGAIGLMQLMPATAKELDVNPYDARDNAKGGVRYLKQLAQRFPDDERKQVAAYNAGPGAVQKYGGVPPYKETRSFVQRVFASIGPREAEAATGTDWQKELFGETAAPQNAPAVRDWNQELFGSTPASSAWDTAAPDFMPQPVKQPEQETPAPRLPWWQTFAAGMEGTDPTMRPGVLARETLPPAHAHALEASQREGDRQVLATGIGTALPAGGAALGAFAGPGGAVTGEIVGSAAARWLNVKLGLEEPGVVGDVASVAVPAVVRTVAPVGRAMLRNLPGANVVKHEVAQEGLNRLGTRLQPVVTSETLYGQAATQGARIPVPTLRQKVAAILARESRLQPGFQLTQTTQDQIRDLSQLAMQHNGFVPLDLLRDHHQRLRLLVNQAARENWPQQQALQDLYGAIYRDLEGAASHGIAGAEQLIAANRAYRTEQALDTLTDLWSPGKGIQQLDGDVTQVYGKRIQNQFEKRLTDDALFRGSFTPAELQDIRGTLREVARLTRRAPTATSGISTRAAQWLGRATGLASAAQGEPMMAGALLVGVESAPYLLSAALLTGPGRAAVRRALAAGQGHLTPAGLALISQAIRGEGVVTSPADDAPPPR